MMREMLAKLAAMFHPAITEDEMTKKRVEAMEMSLLYDEYKVLCMDRGIFPKGFMELCNQDTKAWLTYGIDLIRRGYPSQAERQESIQEEDARGPGRKRGDI